MDCHQIQSRIAEFSVGLLGAREQARVEEHLAACLACGRELQQMQAVVSMVERHGSREPPPHLWNGVYNRITTEPAPRPGFWEWLLGNTRRVMVSAATSTAAAALLVILAYDPVAVRKLVPDATAPVPKQVAMAVQQHALLASAEPFADVVGLEAYALLVRTPSADTRSVQ